MKVTKLLSLIQEAQNLSAEMKELKSDPAVLEYLSAEEERKALHRAIGEHITRYNVNTEAYKPLGLVERNNSWVKVGDVGDFADEHPALRDAILGLINTKKVFYTK